MRFKGLSIFLAILILALAVSVAGADGPTPIEPLTQPPSAETGEMVDETPNAWFVEFKTPPTINGGKLKDTKADKAKFYAAAKAAGIEISERFAFDTLWNGISIQVGPADVNKLASLPGVKAVYPVLQVAIPETISGGSPELYTAIQMTGADIAQSELGYTGEGIRVAVMDTGIDYDHPDLGGCFGPGCRVAFGYDLVGDDYNADSTAPSYNPIPSPDPDPDDCQGHGTHVSGIVGANGTVVGVAPDVTFGAYRVFGCEGSTDTDIMIAAMEMALKDKMDILNMSIGSAFTWPQYPTAVAANNLVKHGMVVVASIGNSGASGLYSAGSPGLGEDVIGVAAFDNTTSIQPAFSVSPDETLVGYNAAAAAPPPPTNGTYPMARTGTTASTADGCSAFPAGSLDGYIALIRRGTCSFWTKAYNAQNAGAIGVVLYNNTTGALNPTVAGSPAITIPVVAITAADGALIDGRLATGDTYLTWTTETVASAVPTAGLISSFSSYGLAPDLSLKPDIGAPGGNIWSTYPLEKGGYANLGGTSMASPHVAGAAALLLQAHPGLDAHTVRDVLQNSADPKAWWGNPGLGFLDNVHRQGAGMVDIDDALMATTLVTPGKIATGESEAGPFTQTLTVHNNGTAAVTYDLSYVNALSTSGVISPSFFTSSATVDFSAASVTVQPGGMSTVDATINAPASPVNGQYGGYIVFTPQGGGQVFRVPFAGFVGDYQGIQALTPTANGFPWLAYLDGGFYNKNTGPADWVYTMEGQDIPYLLIHLEHQVELLRIEIFTADGKPLHPVFSTAIFEEYLPRNSTSTGFFAFAWDGSRIHSNGYNGTGYTKNLTKPVADGEYYLVVNALKANGDPNNPAHWETWTSPIIAIDRP